MILPVVVAAASRTPQRVCSAGVFLCGWLGFSCLTRVFIGLFTGALGGARTRDQ